jgi:bifunctional N-acetylglucosamine-1-phosphate-uridyltransferase/glucosamine-1-phosphate-acetyltransferase GlmU-like protein
LIGAGSTITKNVKDNMLALSRTSQRELKKKKK